MREYLTRLFRLVFGLFLYALGAVFILDAKIGYDPWNVLHVGVSYTLGISVGTASIAVGLLIVIVVLLFKEKLGLGTILNMILIGAWMDLILWLRIIPIAAGTVPGIAMLAAGLFIIALASYFYIGSAFGAGPRDSLMVVLTRKTKLPIGVCRSIIEFSALAIGWLLGGMIGIGTVISVIGIGFAVQITFKILNFDATGIKHETLDQTLNTILRK